MTRLLRYSVCENNKVIKAKLHKYYAVIFLFQKKMFLIKIKSGMETNFLLLNFFSKTKF